MQRIHNKVIVHSFEYASHNVRLTYYIVSTNAMEKPVLVFNYVTQ